MINATLREVIEAQAALASIGESRLPPKAAWRVGRLSGKLNGLVREFNETRRKLLLDHGGIAEGTSVVLRAPERRDDEDSAEFEKRQAEHKDKMVKLNDALEVLLKEGEEVDYDPLPLSLFEHEKDPEKSVGLKPNDVAGMGPFLKE